MSLRSICWNLFKLLRYDYILQKGDAFFKSIIEFRYFVLEDVLHGLLTENCLIALDFLENRREEIAAGVYVVSITEIISSCRQVGSGILLIVNNYVLGLLLENQCFYVFHLHSKE